MRWTALLWLLACGDKGGDSGGGEPTFSRVRDEVLVPSCAFSSCHGSGTGGLSIDESGGYEALVDVESVGMPGEILVIPGDPDQSYLVRKLEGGPDIAGDEMPPGGLLDEERLQLVRDWIAAGAQDD